MWYIVRSTRLGCNRFSAAAKSGNWGGRRSSAAPRAIVEVGCWRTPPTTRSTTFPESALALWPSADQEIERTRTRMGSETPSRVFRDIRDFKRVKHFRTMVGLFRVMRGLPLSRRLRDTRSRLHRVIRDRRDKALYPFASRRILAPNSSWTWTLRSRVSSR